MIVECMCISHNNNNSNNNNNNNINNKQIFLGAAIATFEAEKYFLSF